MKFCTLSSVAIGATAPPPLVTPPRYAVQPAGIQLINTYGTTSTTKSISLIMHNAVLEIDLWIIMPSIDRCRHTSRQVSLQVVYCKGRRFRRIRCRNARIEPCVVYCVANECRRRLCRVQEHREHGWRLQYLWIDCCCCCAGLADYSDVWMLTAKTARTDIACVLRGVGSMQWLKWGGLSPPPCFDFGGVCPPPC